MIEILKHDTKDEFIHQYHLLGDTNLSNKDLINLLIETMSLHKSYSVDIFDMLLKNIQDINQSVIDINNTHMPLSLNLHDSEITAFEVALVKSNLRAIQKILNCNGFLLTQSTMNLMKRMMRTHNENDEDFWHCFYYIMNNEINSNVRCILLEDAIVSNNKTAIRVLLKSGAYLGYKNKDLNNYAIDYLDFDDLYELFDSNIITTDEFLIIDEFHINYTNLRSPIKEKMPNEMLPIILIAEDNNKRSLLQHPFITSFMALKWQRVSLLFYLNFFISFIAYILMTVCILLKFKIIALSGLFLLIILESIKIVFLGKFYFKVPMNVLQIFSISFYIYTLFARNNLELLNLVINLNLISICAYPLIRDLIFIDRAFERGHINSLVGVVKLLNKFEKFYIPFRKIREDYKRLIFCLNCSCSTQVYLLPNVLKFYLNNTLYCSKCQQALDGMIFFSKILRKSNRAQIHPNVTMSIKKLLLRIEFDQQQKTKLHIASTIKKNRLQNIETKLDTINELLLLLQQSSPSQ